VYDLEKCLSQYRMFLAPIFYGAGVNGKIYEAVSNKIPSIISEFSALQLDVIFHGVMSIMSNEDSKLWAEEIKNCYLDVDNLNSFSLGCLKNDEIFGYSSFNESMNDLFR